MTNRTAAARYARALYDVCLDRHELRKIEGDLAQFHELVTGHEMLGRVLQSPAVPVPNKRAIVGELLSRLEEIAPPVAKLLAMLADRDRLILLPEIIHAYRERVLDHLGIVEAHVTTVQPLTADQTTAIQRLLAEASGREVTMSTEVDPGILGGIVARLGSTVYDASIARHLERMRQTLLAR
ncbi:MAG: ATP synthase F1 subunit delta [Acidobacteriota bacterium]|nr:ATP synthase F1 subunit delta [Acidobacteriota bacterium]